MGCNLAFNLSANEYSTVLFYSCLENMCREKINKYVVEVQEKGILAATSVDMLFGLLDKPRIIFVISQSNSYTEDVLKQLIETLEADDILIDTCDTNYKISANRCRNFEKKQIKYIGAGFSSTNVDALDGVSIMAGGSFDAYNEIFDILSCISSKYDGLPCCAYMGPDGAGQYVKMLHNGIEYGIMQAVSESISLLKHITCFDVTEISEILHEWSEGENECYFLQAAYDILSRVDPDTELPIYDIVSDKVGYNRSVIWLCSSAVELLVPVPSIYAALYQRFLTNQKKNRENLADKTDFAISDANIINIRKKYFVEEIRNSLYLTSLCVYIQAYMLLKRASDIYVWETDPVDVSITFQGVSFIRSKILSRVLDAFRNNGEIKCLLEDDYFSSNIKKYMPSLRKIVGLATECGISIPIMSSSLSYLDTYCTSDLDTGIIELLRDYIQGTGFEKKNIPQKRFHADWKNTLSKVPIEEIQKQ